MKSRIFLLLSALLLLLPLCHAANAQDEPFIAWQHDQEWNALTNHLTACYQGIVDRCDALKYYTEARGGRMNDVVVPPEPPTFIWPVYDYIRFAKKIDQLAPHFVRLDLQDADGSLDAYFATGGIDDAMWSVESLRLSAAGSTNWSTNMLLHSWALADHSIQKEVSEALNLLKWTKAGNAGWTAGTEGEITGNHGVASCRASYVEGTRTHSSAMDTNLAAAISRAVEGAVTETITDGNPGKVERGSLVEINSYYQAYIASLEIIDAKLHLENMNTNISNLAVTIVGCAGDNDLNQGTGWRYAGTILGAADMADASEYTSSESVLGDLGTSVDNLYWGLHPNGSYYVAGDRVSILDGDLYLYYHWTPDPLCDELTWNMIKPGMYGVDEWRNAGIGLMSADSQDGMPPEMYSLGYVAGIVPRWVEFHSTRSRFSVRHLNTNTAHEVDYYARARAFGADDPDYHAEFDGCGTGLNQDQLSRFDTSSMSSLSNAVSTVLGHKERAPLWTETEHCPYGVNLHSRGFKVDLSLAVIKWAFPETPVIEQEKVAVSPDMDRDGLLDIGVVPDTLALRTGFAVMDPRGNGPIIYMPLVSTPAWYRGLRVNTFWCQGAFSELPYHYLSRNEERTDYYPEYCYDDDGPYQAFSLNTRIMESAAVDNDDRHEKCVSVLRPHGTFVVFDFPWDPAEQAFSEKGFPTGVNSNRTYVLRDLTPEDHRDLKYELMFDSGISHIYGAEKWSLSWGRGDGWLKKVVYQGIPELRWADADWYWPEEYSPETLPGGEVYWVEEFLRPPSATDTRFSTTWEWDEGLITRFTLRSAANSSVSIEVRPAYDEEGHMTGLAKTGVNGIEASNLSINSKAGGESIDYSWGSLLMTSSAPQGHARDVRLTRTLESVVGDVQESYSFDVRDRLIRRAITANGQTVETGFEYFDEDGRYDNGALKSSKLKTARYFDGGESHLEYASDTGWLVRNSSPMGNGTVTSTRYGYDSADTEGDASEPSLLAERPRKVEGYVDDTCISRQLFAYRGLAETIREVCSESSAAWGSTGNLRFVDSYEVDPDTWDMIRIGLPVSSAGPLEQTSYACTTWQNILQIHASQTDGKSFTTKHNPAGVRIYSDIAEDSVTTAAQQVSVDALFRPVRATDLIDGTYTENRDYNLFGPQAVCDVDGSVSAIEYYISGWPKSRTDGATGIKTERVYDVLGNVVETKTTGTGGETITESAAHDALGRQTYGMNRYGGETRTVYSPLTGIGTRAVTTLPRGGVVQRDVFLDGSLKEISGNGSSAHIRKKYGIKDGSVCETSIAVGDAGEETEWTEAYYNMLGQVFKTKRPSDDGTVVESINLFDSKARSVGHVDASGIRTLRHFNEKNEMSDAGTHVDGQVSQLTAASSDRYRSFDRIVSPEGVLNQTLVRPFNGVGIAQVLSMSERSFDGRSWSSTHAGRTSIGDRTEYQPGGQYEVTQRGSSGQWTRSRYDKWQLSRKERYDRSNRLIEFEQRSYNGLGELRQVSHSRDGITTYQYDSRQRLSSIIPSDPSKGMTFISYEPGTSMRSSVTQSDGKQVFYDYWPNGLLKREYGAQAAVYYDYDSQGRKTLMMTWRDGNPIATEWKYNRHTGQLQEKWIAGRRMEQFAYRANGQLSSKIDAEGVASICSYGPAGDLQEVATSDGTLRTVNSFNRMGQVVATADDGAIGEAYSRTIDGLIASVSVDGGGIVSNSTVSYVRNPESAAIDRINWNVDGVASGAMDIVRDDFERLSELQAGNLKVRYSYPTNGTMVTGVVFEHEGEEVMSRNTSWDFVNKRPDVIDYRGVNSQLAEYGYTYETNSDRIAKITREDGAHWEYDYDQTNRLVSGVLCTSNGIPVPGMQFAYQYDEIGNITAKGLVGDDGDPWHSFESDDRNAHVLRSWANLLPVRGAAHTGIVVAANMVEAERYGSNFFAAVPVQRGAMALWTNITVMAVERDEAGDKVAIENDSIYIASANEAVGYGNNGWTKGDSIFRYGWDPKGRLIWAESEGKGMRVEFDYYPDGRRASKQVFDKLGPHLSPKEWRLARKHEYYYDGWNVIAELQIKHWVPAAHSAGDGFIYHSTTNVKHYIWGLDIAEQRDGGRNSHSSPGAVAGGIGGLLAIQDVSVSGTNTYVTVSDHQGNIHKIVDAETGNVIEEYTYSPYGEILSFISHTSDFSIPACPFRFQSKCYDSETGLYYYGYRYYNPSSGKWLSPDPIREGDGPNMYAFCSNDPVNGIDPLGLAIYAFDGTGNDRSDPTKMPTHVAALVQMYDPDKTPFYINGVGTRTQKFSGALFGNGARDRLNSMFKAFEQTYANGTGDTDIDILGFSRGAAMAREFANMIHDKYPDAKIRFLGLFDTVAQVGSPDPANINPGIRLDIPDNVEFVAHAVAQNEYRSLFPLTSVAHAYGGTYIGWSLPTLIRIGPNKFKSGDYAELKGKRFHEKPFAGAHSNIGGGYPEGTNLDALWWMAAMGREHGVPFDVGRFETEVPFPDGTSWKYRQKTGGWHDSRYSGLDRIPGTGIGRSSRVIYSGNLQVQP